MDFLLPPFSLRFLLSFLPFILILLTQFLHCFTYLQPPIMLFPLLSMYSGVVLQSSNSPILKALTFTSLLLIHALFLLFFQYLLPARFIIF